MWLITISLIVFGIVVCYIFVKAVNAIFNPIIKRLEDKKRSITQQDNPYVMAHRLKMKNDQMYEEYLQWLDKSGGDIPFEKWKTREEQQFDKKYEDAQFKKWRPNR